MYRRSNFIFSRITLLQNSILSKIEICEENYAKNDMIVCKKNGVIESDYSFYDEHVCFYRNCGYVFVDKKEYYNHEGNDKSIVIFRKIKNKVK
jgi:hypothetical protein